MGVQFGGTSSLCCAALCRRYFVVGHTGRPRILAPPVLVAPVLRLAAYSNADGGQCHGWSTDPFLTTAQHVYMLTANPKG